MIDTNRDERPILSLLAAALGMTILSGSFSVSAAATFIVNRTADALDTHPGDGICGTSSGACTLRAAIMEANALGGADTITIPAGTITLTIHGTDEDAAATGDLDITDALTINGSGAAETIINGNGAVLGDRVFHVIGSTSVTITDLTIRGGRATDGPNHHGFSRGGGIYSDGTLTVTRIRLENNSATRDGINQSDSGGIWTGGVATITDSVFLANSADYGGALVNAGTASVLRCVFQSNYGSQASAIYNGAGELTLTDSTLSEHSGSVALANQATLELVGSTLSNNTAGAIANYAQLSAFNCTVAGNSGRTGSGLLNIGYNAVATIVNCSFSNNNDPLYGAGVQNIGYSWALTLRNTIVADSVSGPNCRWDMTDAGGNLSWPADGGCPGLVADPKLGFLTDNGGPTQTLALLSGSAALDAASVGTCPATDQRGISRPQGASCDIGAFEVVHCAGVVCTPIESCHLVETCDAMTGTCSEAIRPNDSLCSDNDVCTTSDTCVDGSCRGTSIVCNDDNPCTDDGCDAATGCVFTNNTNPCDDDNACTSNDTCSPSQGSGRFAENFDSVSVPALPVGWTSSVAGIGTPWVTRVTSTQTSAFGLDSDHTADEVLDTPPIAITSAPAKLTFRNRWRFDDDTEPYDGSVLEIKIGLGSFVDIEAAGRNFVSGGYTGTVDPNYGNPLANRAAWCSMSPGYPAYITTKVNLPAAAVGQTIQLRWRVGSDSSAASVGQDIDSILVTFGEPDNSCHGGPAPDCNDNNSCTDDSCDVATGCVHTNNNKACDDGNTCTANDTCTGGVCTGGPALDCNDNNPCTGDSCNPTTACVHTNNAASCSAGNACSVGDTCSAGTCHAGAPVVCNDNNVCTTDACNPATGCVFTNNTNPCDDGNACTSGDTCGGGVCHAGGPTNCDDGNCCTIDSCNPATGCMHVANTAAPVFTTQPTLGDTILWPPEHGYADFTVASTGAAATSSCGIASIQFASCSSSQPENGHGTGDGNTIGDCVYEPGALHVRAERDGACSPIGRVYETTLDAIDVCGNVTTSNLVDVNVWHDRAQAPTQGTVRLSTGNSQDVRNGTNGTYGTDCGTGAPSSNGTNHDHSDADPEMEISQNAAVSVGDLHLGKTSGGNVQLTWSDPTLLSATHVTRWHVYRLDPATLFWTQIAKVPKQELSYQDASLDDGGNWQYKVTAVIK